MYASFYDELEKIAAGRAKKGPGSRGGKVVGYTKSGRPIYQSSVNRRKEKKKKEERGRKLKRNIATAAAVAATGLRLHYELKEFKRDMGWAYKSRPQYSTYTGRGGQAWGRYGQTAQKADQAEAAKSKIPDLGKARTKVEAVAAYRSAAKRHHPDRGGSEKKMKETNTAWDVFRRSPLYEKLAMARWSSMANLLQ